MRAFDELVLVNYCYHNCTPLMNIMRLSKADAFQLAKKLAKEHPNTAAFYRFADFENYYTLRSAQDAFLYTRFLELGGTPEEEHPLSFVLEGSDYLRSWFGNGVETVVPLKGISPCHISFTIGDSGAEFQKKGKVKLFSLDGLRQLLDTYHGDFSSILHRAGYHYIEAQLWCDNYLK